MNKKNNTKFGIKFSRTLTLLLFAIFFLLPIIYTISNSFMSNSEISNYYNAGNQAKFHILPEVFSLEGYYTILISRPDFLIKFWISIGLSSIIVIGQLVISTLAGYGFAKFKFPFRDMIFFTIIILMMMPYQVTLVSNYIVLDKMKLLGGYPAIILPAVFSPFGVFLMRQVMTSMPNEYIESAKIDGANQFQILFYIIMPYCKPGIISLVILGFIDSWNMVEQPLVFLNDSFKYPMSIFLSQVNQINPVASFACGVLAMLPVTMLFLFYEKELVDGIGLSVLK